MKQYLELGNHIKKHGRMKLDRTGTGRLSIFGYQFRCDLNEGFPLLTSKEMNLKPIFDELVWILSGSTNNNDLEARGTKIWRAWADFDGELGPVYGDQWRNWFGVRVIQSPATYEQFMTRATEEQVTAVEKDMMELALTAMDVAERGEAVRAIMTKHGVETNIMIDQFVVENVDQIKVLLDNLKNRPFSSRHVITAWNPSVLPDEAASNSTNIRNGRQVIPACHAMFQFHVDPMTMEEILDDGIERGFFSDVTAAKDWWWENVLAADVRTQEHPDHLSMSAEEQQADLVEVFNGQEEMRKRCKAKGLLTLRLSCQLYQRSADVPVGVPFNVASYALLTHMVAQVVGMAVGDFVHTFGDAHVYANQRTKFWEQIRRIPYRLPKLRLDPTVTDLFAFEYDDVLLEDYEHHPKVVYAVAVGNEDKKEAKQLDERN